MKEFGPAPKAPALDVGWLWHDVWLAREHGGEANYLAVHLDIDWLEPSMSELLFGQSRFEVRFCHN